MTILHDKSYIDASELFDGMLPYDRFKFVEEVLHTDVYTIYQRNVDTQKEINRRIRMHIFIYGKDDIMACFGYHYIGLEEEIYQILVKGKKPSEVINRKGVPQEWLDDKELCWERKFINWCNDKLRRTFEKIL